MYRWGTNVIQMTMTVIRPMRKSVLPGTSIEQTNALHRLGTTQRKPIITHRTSTHRGGARSRDQAIHPREMRRAALFPGYSLRASERTTRTYWRAYPHDRESIEYHSHARLSSRRSRNEEDGAPRWGTRRILTYTLWIAARAAPRPSRAIDPPAPVTGPGAPIRASPRPRTLCDGRASVSKRSARYTRMPKSAHGSGSPSPEPKSPRIGALRPQGSAELLAQIRANTVLHGRTAVRQIVTRAPRFLATSWTVTHLTANVLCPLYLLGR